MDLSEYDFETLKDARLYCDTLAYWIGVLSEFSADFTCDAYDACGVMSYQFDVEEQTDSIDGFLNFRPLGLPNFLPIAPVTLAFQWSPFPSAGAALGSPVFAHRGDYGSALAVFHPVETPTFPAASADERHFQFLLHHACDRAFRSHGHVLIAGSPGWSYECDDFFIDERKDLMAEFGFVYYDRKPVDA